MLCVHTADTKAKDLLDLSLDIFYLHFVSQNSELVCQQQQRQQMTFPITSAGAWWKA